jgi:hypothetical protein
MNGSWQAHRSRRHTPVEQPCNEQSKTLLPVTSVVVDAGGAVGLGACGVTANVVTVGWVMEVTGTSEAVDGEIVGLNINVVGSVIVWPMQQLMSRGSVSQRVAPLDVLTNGFVQLADLGTSLHHP